MAAHRVKGIEPAPPGTTGQRARSAARRRRCWWWPSAPPGAPAEQVVHRPGAALTRSCLAARRGIPLQVLLVEADLSATCLDHGSQLELRKAGGVPGIAAMVIGEQQAAGLDVAGAGLRDAARIEGQEQVEAALGNGQVGREVLLYEADEGPLPVV